MLAIFLLPSAAMVLTIAYVVAEEMTPFAYPYQRRSAWIAAAVVTWLFVGAYWIFLWRKSVRWSDRRKRLTLFSVCAAAIIGAIGGGLMRPFDRDFGFFVFTAVTILAWLPMTVFIWRETAAERSERSGSHATLTCPTCGYNLTGLSTARCPECGSTFTLDELLSKQPLQEQSELN